MSYTVEELDELFRSNALERIGMGSRRACYRLPCGKLCVKCYRSDKEILEGKDPGSPNSRPICVRILRFGLFQQLVDSCLYGIVVIACSFQFCLAVRTVAVFAANDSLRNVIQVSCRCDRLAGKFCVDCRLNLVIVETGSLQFCLTVCAVAEFTARIARESPGCFNARIAPGSSAGTPQTTTGNPPVAGGEINRISRIMDSLANAAAVNE